jgi:hypothetical protein
VVPRTSVSAPSPDSVTVQELVEQLTPFEEKEQADSGRSSAAATSGAAIRVDVEGMSRA